MFAWPSKVTTEKNVAVVKVLGPYRFTFQPVGSDNVLFGHEFTEDICPDFAAPGDDFKEGTILNELIHTVQNGCWSLDPDKHCGWYKRRDKVTKEPIYAKEAVNGG